MDVELMLLSSNLNFIDFSIYLDDLYDQVFSLFILTIAASESAVGLAIVIIYYQASLRQTDSQKSDINSNQSTDSIADPDNEGGESEEEKKKKKALPRVLTEEEQNKKYNEALEELESALILVALIALIVVIREIWGQGK
jgi:Ca2+/H+ antiporter